MTGIYCYTNKSNGYKYVGKAINIKNRLENHKYRFNNPNDSGFNQPFHQALREFGYDDFEIEILEECEESILDKRETYWIYTLRTMVPFGYNVLSPSKTVEEYLQLKPKKEIPMKTTKIGELTDELFLALAKDILTTSYSCVAKRYGYTHGKNLKKILKSKGYPSEKDELAEYYFNKTQQHLPKNKKHNEVKCSGKTTPIPVAIISTDGEIVKTYKSISEASKDGFNKWHIYDCLKGNRRTVNGVRFIKNS